MAQKSSSSPKGKILKGVFCDSPVQGLEYRTLTLAGITDEKGQFQYRPGETVNFSIGELMLGAPPGQHG